MISWGKKQPISLIACVAVLVAPGLALADTPAGTTGSAPLVASTDSSSATSSGSAAGSGSSAGGQCGGVQRFGCKHRFGHRQLVGGCRHIVFGCRCGQRVSGSAGWERHGHACRPGCA